MKHIQKGMNQSVFIMKIQILPTEMFKVEHNTPRNYYIFL